MKSWDVLEKLGYWRLLKKGIGPWGQEVGYLVAQFVSGLVG
jgi:hypothetical protein